MKNILLIFTDQLAWRALPSYGNRDQLSVPNINRIAQSATQFEQCYTPFPLCQPARASYWTGRFPHETGVVSNNGIFQIGEIPPTMPTLGETFHNAGFETVHFGKRHDAGALRGFVCEPELELPVEDDTPWDYNTDSKRDRYTTVKAVEYLSQPKDKPFFAAIDYVNPHDICSWIGTNQGEHENRPIGKELPPLPENFSFDDIANRPSAVQYICCAHNRQAQSSLWNDEDFQYYLAAYYHYLERVDWEIGQVLNALEESGQAEDTLVIFTSDHGDNMGSRRMVTKDISFYEETTRVPLLFHLPGRTGETHRNESLASLLDLFPTLCDLFAVPKPEGLRGRSLAPAIAGETLSRDYVISQWHTEWGYSISPGRMLCDGRYKYTCYRNDGEELFDLQSDPLEQVNQTENPAYQEILAEKRQQLDEYLSASGDNFKELTWSEWEDDPKWRSHTVGYQNHRGPASPMAAGHGPHVRPPGK